MGDWYSDADSARDYWVGRNYDVPVDAADDNTVNAALLVGSEYIDSTYWTLFSGLKVGLRDQVREWPRTGAFDTLGYVIDPAAFPRELLNAVYEATLRELQSPGSLTVDAKISETVRSVNVEGAVSVTFAGTRETFSAADLQLQIPIIDRIIANILTGGDGNDNYSSLAGGLVRV